MGTTRELATRERLLREAAHQFARLGFEGASLRRIAERVGIRAATVYSHFAGGKQELYDEILATVSSLLIERIAHRYGQNTGLAAPDVIVQMCAAFWDFCEDHPGYATLLLREAFETDGSALMGDHGATQQVVAACVGYVEAAQAHGELSGFDVEEFGLWVASFMLSYHGAPGLRISLQREPWECEAARERFVRMVRALVQGSAMISSLGTGANEC